MPRGDRKKYTSRDPNIDSKIPGTKEYLCCRIGRNIEYTTSCWNWTAGNNMAGTNKTGYAVVQWRKKQFYVHRTLFELLKGKIKNDLHVLHSCDNTKCVNPEHLKLGTHSENMMDKTEKKRHYFGERHYQSILKERDVRLILSLSKIYSIKDIFERFYPHLKYVHIKKIVDRKIWGHVND